MLQHTPGVGLDKLRAFHNMMAQHQAAIACKIDIDNLNVGVNEADIMLSRQLAPHPTEATLIMNGVHPDASALSRIVMQMKHTEVPH